MSNISPDTVQYYGLAYQSQYTYFVSPADLLYEPVRDTNYTFSVTAWQNENNKQRGAVPVPEDYTLELFVVNQLAPLPDKWRWFPDIGDNGTCHGDERSDDGCRILFNTTVVTAFPLGQANAVRYSVTFQLPKDRHMQLAFIYRSRLGTSTSGQYFYFANASLVRHPRPRSFPAPLSGAPEIVADVRAPVVATAPQTNCPHLQPGLRNWHDPTLWGGRVPTSGNVQLPNNTNVLISSCSIDPAAQFGTIRVPSNSSLIFSDANMSIQVGNIVVDGYLAMGSPTCRLHSYITITLLDSAEEVDSHIGRKGIVATTTGKLDMHGKLYQKTWTRLASSVEPLDDRIQVTDNVNWEVGQKVVVITSIWRDLEDNQNEIRTIKAIQGRKIQFTEPLNFFHYAGPEYQVEVVLLSRRLLIQGDEASEAPKRGGHIMSHGAIARFSGVQGYRMGQMNVLARYPFHFHLMGSAPESFMQDCSVYHSYFRCFTIHGTNDTRISRNTAFDVRGHCFYLEDGVEENNLFEYNFAGYPIPVKDIDFSQDFSQQGPTMYEAPDLLIPADAAPSGFYISNSNNQFVGNAGSGGFAVYSFINFATPIGNFKDLPGFVPMNRPFGRFYGNSAHSAAYQWASAACIYVGGMQRYVNVNGSTILEYNIGRHERDTRDINGQTQFFRFEDNRAFLCNRGLNHWGERVEAIGYEAHDVTKGITLFGEAFLKNTIIEGRSANPILKFPDQNGFEWYDIYVQTILHNVMFRNFAYAGPDNPNAFGLRNYAIVSLTHSDKFKPQGISASKNVTFVNVWENGRLGNKVRDTGASRFYNIMDWDNSLVEHPRAGNGMVVLGSANDQLFDPADNSTMRIKEWWLFDGNDCILYPQYVMYACRKHADNEVVSINLDVDQLTNSFASYPSDWGEKPNGLRYGTVSQFGFTGAARRAAIITANPGVTGLSGDYGWYIYFNAGSPDDFRIRTAQLPNVNGTHMHVIAAIKYPSAAQFWFRTYHQWQSALRTNLTKVTTFAQVYSDPLGLSYVELPASTGEKWVIFKMINRDKDLTGNPTTSGFFERDGIRVYDAYAGTYSYLLKVTSCPSCTTATAPGGALMYPVTDQVPPSVASLRASP